MDELIKKLKELLDTLNSFEEIAEKFMDALRSVSKEASDASIDIEKFENAVKQLVKDALIRFGKSVEEAEMYVEGLTDALHKNIQAQYDSATAGKTAGDMFREATEAAKEKSKATQDNTKDTQENTEATNENTEATNENTEATDENAEAAGEASEFWKQFRSQYRYASQSAGLLGNSLTSLTAAMNLLTGQGRVAINMVILLRNVIQSNLNAVRAGVSWIDLFKGSISSLWSTFRGFAGFLLPLIITLGSLWVAFSNLYHNLRPFKEFIDDLISAFQELWRKITDFTDSIGLSAFAASRFNDELEAMEKYLTDITRLFGSFNSMLSSYQSKNLEYYAANDKFMKKYGENAKDVMTDIQAVYDQAVEEGRISQAQAMDWASAYGYLTRKQQQHIRTLVVSLRNIENENTVNQETVKTYLKEVDALKLLDNEREEARIRLVGLTEQQRQNDLWAQKLTYDEQTEQLEDLTEQQRKLQIELTKSTKIGNDYTRQIELEISERQDLIDAINRNRKEKDGDTESTRKSIRTASEYYLAFLRSQEALKLSIEEIKKQAFAKEIKTWSDRIEYYNSVAKEQEPIMASLGEQIKVLDQEEKDLVDELNRGNVSEARNIEITERRAAIKQEIADLNVKVAASEKIVTDATRGSAQAQREWINADESVARTLQLHTQRMSQLRVQTLAMIKELQGSKLQGSFFSNLFSQSGFENDPLGEKALETARLQQQAMTDILAEEEAKRDALHQEFLEHSSDETKKAWEDQVKVVETAQANVYKSTEQTLKAENDLILNIAKNTLQVHTMIAESLGSMFGSMAEMAEENSDEQKALLTLQAISNMYAASLQLWAGPPVGVDGVVAKGIAQAALIAALIPQIHKIMNPTLSDVNSTTNPVQSLQGSPVQYMWANQSIPTSPNIQRSISQQTGYTMASAENTALLSSTVTDQRVYVVEQDIARVTKKAVVRETSWM